MFKDQLLQHYETEYNLLEAAQRVLKNWEDRGDGTVDFRHIEVLEAWCILSRASFEDMALEKLAIEAALEADKAAQKGYEERTRMMQKTLIDNLEKKIKTPKRGRKRVNCKVCGTPLTGKQRMFCSHACGQKHHNGLRDRAKK